MDLILFQESIFSHKNQMCQFLVSSFYPVIESGELTGPKRNGSSQDFGPASNEPNDAVLQKISRLWFWMQHLQTITIALDTFGFFQRTQQTKSY